MTSIHSSETGILKIMLFPHKIASICSNQADTSYPISVELSLTSRCNAGCIWCGDIALRTSSPSDLSYAAACSLFEDLFAGGTRGLVIEGGGEPMLHPQFREIVEAAVRSGLKIGLITNGTIKLAEDMISKFSWIRISLDAANREQYLEIKKVDLFDQTMANIGFIGENKFNTVLGIGYVISSLNSKDKKLLSCVVRTLRSYGVDYIQFRPVVDHPDLAANIDLGFLSTFNSINFNIDIGALKTNTITGNGGKTCVAHSLTSIINSDGNVYLCGRLNMHSWITPIGNIKKSSYHEVWNSHERLRQINKVSNPDFCLKYCPSCRMVKYNQLLHYLKEIRTKDFI